MLVLKSTVLIPLLARVAYDVLAEDVITYRTHPELATPRWILNITQPDKVTPGYWFVSPFDSLSAHPDPKPGWLAPSIFDGQGELVWSGWDVMPGVSFDFKLSNVLGQPHLNLVNFEEQVAYILGPKFDNLDTIDLTDNFDAHELFFVDDGHTGIRTIATYKSYNTTELMPSIPTWYADTQCIFQGGGFEAFDVATLTPRFTWNSFDHIPISHGATGDYSSGDCGSFSDYVHVNSVDKDHLGDYYLSARHTDSIYKISKDDGHVIWRLHGLQIADGPWDMGGLTFARQHNIRFHGFNGTHEIISLLDNAQGEDSRAPTHDRSRALTIALQPNARPPTARLISEIGHPGGAGGYAHRRGNYQLLENGHKWIGWSEQALHSEHDANGEIVMSAWLQASELGTYRSYKFDFYGRPSYPPRAVAAAEYDPTSKSTLTVVYVSWNGATDVASYKMYQTDSLGKHRREITQTRRTGFETLLVWKEFASHVVLLALGEDGSVLGETEVTVTNTWRGDIPASRTSKQTTLPSTIGSVLLFITASCLLVAMIATAVLLQRKFKPSWVKHRLPIFEHRYNAVPSVQEKENDDLGYADSIRSTIALLVERCN